jgi:hypothetical protein
MIHAQQYSQALRTFQRLVVQAKAQACEAGQDRLAELLNDVELLPEFLADQSDRTGEFTEMLQGIARVHPRCRYIVEEFARVSPGSA